MFAAIPRIITCRLYNFTVFNPNNKEGMYQSIYSSVEDISKISPLYTFNTTINVEKKGRNKEYL
tara:strand:+ start:926 stop:1117 length:192 start_codon:yes stop_codon:yes gene_type:complete